MPEVVPIGILLWIGMRRPMDSLIAVRPLPKRSYDAPTRGLKSFQFGTFFTGAKSRAGTHGPAGRCCSGMEPLTNSSRPPRFSVRRFIVHCSCAYSAPCSTRFLFSYGVAQYVIDSGTCLLYTSDAADER